MLPSFLTQPRPDPGLRGLQMGMALGGALQEYRKQQLQQQLTQQQIAAGQTAQQAAQARLGALPQQLAAEQQQRILANQQMHHQLAMGQMTMDQAHHVMLGNRLSDLASLPENMRGGEYQNIKQEMREQGFDVNKMPKTYDANAQALTALAVQKSPASAEVRKQSFELAKQRLQQMGQLEVEKMKLGVPVATKAFQTEEGKKNSAFFDDVQKGSDNAGEVLNDVQQMRGIAGQIPARFGLVRGNMIELSSLGQQFLMNNYKLILDLFKQMPHIGRGGQLLLRTIKKSKPSANMSNEALQKSLNAYEAGAKLLIEKNQFSTFMKSRNIFDRNKIQGIWDNFTSTYPTIDARGNTDPKMASKWVDFLQHNPHVLTELGGKRVMNITPTMGGTPSGFNWPGGMKPGRQPQTAQQPVAPQPQQAVTGPPGPMQRSPYMQPNPYDVLGQ